MQSLKTAGIVMACAGLFVSGGEWFGTTEGRDPAGLASVRPDKFNMYDTTVFVLAAESGDESVIRLYLRQGFDPNSFDQNYNTALMAACLNGHLDIVKLLLKASANPHLKNNEGLSAIDFSHIRGDQMTSDIMLAAHPSPFQ